MKKRIGFFIFFCFLFGYVLIFPHQLKKELIVTPSWAVDISSPPGTAVEGAGYIPFKLDDRLGYFTGSGQIVFSEEILFEAEITENFFVNYSSVSTSLVLQRTNGRIISSIETEGFPFFVKGRFFVISPDRLTISEYNTEGELLWKASPGSILTSLDANDRFTIMGMLNGELLLLDEHGERVFSFKSNESRYSVIYGCALSEDAGRIAVISGLYPQQLISFSARNDGYSEDYRRDLSPEYRRNLFMDYSSDGRLLYLENPEGLRVISTDNRREEMLPVPGIVAYSKLRGAENLSFLLSTEEQQNVLQVFRPDIGKAAVFSLPPGKPYFYSGGTSFYIGIGKRIVRYDLIEG